MLRLALSPGRAGIDGRLAVRVLCQAPPTHYRTSAFMRHVFPLWVDSRLSPTTPIDPERRKLGRIDEGDLVLSLPVCDWDWTRCTEPRPDLVGLHRWRHPWIPVVGPSTLPACEVGYFQWPLSPARPPIRRWLSPPWREQRYRMRHVESRFRSGPSVYPCANSIRAWCRNYHCAARRIRTRYMRACSLIGCAVPTAFGSRPT